jgi:hypothetical protein
MFRCIIILLLRRVYIINIIILCELVYNPRVDAMWKSTGACTIHKYITYHIYNTLVSSSLCMCVSARALAMYTRVVFSGTRTIRQRPVPIMLIHYVYDNTCRPRELKSCVVTIIIMIIVR